jgi:hypothetical protein
MRLEFGSKPGFRDSGETGGGMIENVNVTWSSKYDLSQQCILSAFQKFLVSWHKRHFSIRRMFLSRKPAIKFIANLRIKNANYKPKAADQ